MANDSETERTRYVARVDARSLREVYLAPFERLVAAGAWSVMGAYSGVDDGQTAAPALEHRPLLTEVLKEEWGFDGLVVSDWVATQSVAAAVRGGLDLQMPGPDGPWGDGLLAAVRAGDVSEGELDDKVRRVLRLAHRVGRFRATGPDPSAGTPPAGSAALLREVAARSVVVLKDDAPLVPLVEPGGPGAAGPLRVALLGASAVEPFFAGGGSSFVVPDRLSYPADALREALPAGSRVDVVAGSRALRNPPPLDVATRCTDPVTGAPGVRVEVLGADGAVRRAETRASWDGWYGDLGPDDVVVRLGARVAVPEAGAHELGVGTVGVHRVTVDGRTVASGDVVVDEDVILASGHNHPVARLASVEGGTAGVLLEADLQVVHPVGYDRFVRAALVHRLPGPSAADELEAAVAAARAADVAVVVVGTTPEVESEGFDRADLALPGTQDELVRRVLAANPRTVVVNAGAPVVLPWYDDAPTVLWGWLPGQEAGAALAEVLTGVTEPSGRLPWTLPAHEADVPVPHAVPVAGVVDYAEGLDVGYRAWERRLAEADRAEADRGPAPEPAAPFGHGLGWTTWEYEDARLVGPDAGTVDPGAAAVVRVTVRNTGPRPGREVV